MTPARPEVGSIAGEATLLLDALAAKLSAMPRPEPAQEGASECPECGHDPAAPCAGCPLCKLLALVRGQRPEATAKLLDAAGLVISALRSMLPDQAPDDEAAEAPEPGSDGGLQRIDIR